MKVVLSLVLESVHIDCELAPPKDVVLASVNSGNVLWASS